MNTSRRKKSLGQHFLTSQSAVEKMVEVSDVKKGDMILEIGPGKGVLTEALLRVGANVIAVEKDDLLIPFLSEKFGKEIASGQLKIIHEDILKFNLDFVRFSNLDEIRGVSADGDQNVLSSTLREQTQASNKEVRQIWKPYELIANIPYYITGEIIRMFLTAKNKPRSMTLLVQKEVAERIVAKNKKESVLSLSVKFFGVPKYIQTVKRGSFNPPPKVDSAILRIELRGTNHKLRKEEFFKLVKTGFKSKRKKLISNLSPLYEKEKLSDAFIKISLDENIRAEDLRVEQWLELLKLLNK